MHRHLVALSLGAALGLGITGCDSGPPSLPPLPDAGDFDGGVPDAGADCDNGARDGDETGVDCGGSCPECDDGDPCRVAEDCQSGVCMRGRCLVPSCMDDVRNGLETGTDCGGDCGLCPGGEPCTSNEQCISMRCRGGSCTMSSCDDDRMNGDETDTDCGGGTCPPCNGGDACDVETDCTSLICSGGTCTDAACNDGVQNQDETSVDCGGGVCPPCRDGLACMVDGDCEGMRCLDGGCVSCTDRVRNAEETDVDCGGGLCGACDDGLACVLDTDCENDFCHMGTCISCEDGTQNFDETDVDCGGGRCGGCLNGRMCTGDPDCLSSDCVDGLCRGLGDTCTDAVVLTTGLNVVNWVATSNDYLTTNPSCSATSRDGPDVVMQYTATVDGFMTFSIDKPTSTRWTMLLSDQACGMPTPELVCQSRFTETALSGQIPVRAGTTYTFYVADTTSGAMPLSNPLNVTIDEVVPPCAAGADGVVGDTITRQSTGLTSLAEYYVVPDASPTGFVYFGGSSQLYRAPKAGGAAVDVEAAVGLPSTALGLEMAIAGDDIFVVDSRTTGANLRVFRISSDGGATWIAGGEDYATFDMGATSPNDDFRGAAPDPTNTRMYFITHELTGASEIWSAPLSGAVPVTGRLDTTIAGHQYCSGLAVDDTYYYTACNRPTPSLIRVHRTTGVVDVLSNVIAISSTKNAVWYDDNDADGEADVLYVNVGTEEVYYVCGLGGTPFAAPFVTFGAATGNYGMGFEPGANRLWAYDDDTHEVVIIE